MRSSSSDRRHTHRKGLNGTHYGTKCTVQIFRKANYYSNYGKRLEKQENMNFTIVLVTILTLIR